MRAIPPGGWHIIENGVKLEGSGLENLIDVLTRYRVDNGKDVGNPTKTIQDYVISNWPHFSGSVSVAAPILEQAAVSANPDNLRARVSNWLANRYSLRASNNAVGFATDTEAERRAKICKACHKNQEVQNDCAPCIQSIKRQGFLIREGKETQTKVEACQITGQSNEVAVWLPEELLRHRMKYLDQIKAEAPNCWLLDMNDKKI